MPQPDVAQDQTLISRKEELWCELLLNIAQIIKDEDFKTVKHLCEAYLQPLYLERITDVRELINELRERGVVKWQKTDGWNTLLHVFDIAKLPNIVDIIEVYKNQLSTTGGEPFKQHESVDYFQELINYIGNNLTQENVADLKQNLKGEGKLTRWESCSDGKQLLEKMKHLDLYNKKKMGRLLDFMSGIEREDLATEIKGYIEQLSESMFDKWVNMPEPVASFLRTGNSATLCNQLSTEDNHIALLIGPPGSGKTQLSLQCAKEFGQEAHIFSVICLLPASNEDELLKNLEAFSGSLNIQKLAKGDKKTKESIKIVFKDILNKLSSQASKLAELSSQTCKHLIIFDNLNDPAIFEMIVQTLHNPHIKTIITSNNRHFAQKLNPIDVQGFTKDEALKYFREHKYFDDTKEAAILSMCKLLSFLPLGLDSARSYISISQLTPKSYIDMLTDPELSDIVEEKEKDFLSGYDLPVLKAFQKSISKLNIVKELIMVFYVMCCIHHQDIPLGILSIMLPNVKTRSFMLDNLIQDLQKCSLISITGHDKNRRITMPEVAQLAIRQTLFKEKKADIAEKTLLLLCRCFDTRLIKQFITTDNLVQHVSEAIMYTGMLLKPELFKSSHSSYKKAVAARILLLCIWGYWYTQRGLTKLSEEPLC